MNIETRVEGPRGCGYRKPGALYLVSGGLAEACHLLPWELETCPTCGQGIKPAMGWTWIEAYKLFAPGCDRDKPPQRHCTRCVVCRPEDAGPKSGLIWVGEKYYPTTGQFTYESQNMGVSRRIKSIPRGFKLGATWVFLAHRKAFGQDPQFETYDPEKWKPAIFQVFLPTAIEYVIKGDENEDQLKALVERGITPIRVERAGENRELFQ